MADTIYTAHADVTGGREGGHARTDDGALDVTLDRRGTGSGTNPEQLFAAGYGACFLQALKPAARKQHVDAREASIHVDVDLRKGDDGYGIAAALTVTLPGVEPDRAQQLVEAAHEACPYSRATRGNIDVRVGVGEGAIA